jgi:hypothetical protein
MDMLLAAAQHRERCLFGRASRDEVNGMDGTALADSFNTPDSLLQSKRRPWQLEVDDQAAAAMQVQSLAGRIRRQQQSCVAVGEALNCCAALRRRHPAMQLNRVEVGEALGEANERVAILGENECRLRRSPKQRPQRAQLALGSCRVFRQPQELCQHPSLERGVLQARRGQLGRRLIVGIAGHEGQRGLDDGR